MAPAGVEVVEAQWGVDGHDVDVTERVRSTLAAGKRLEANNGPLELKRDPAEGRVKRLRLTLRAGGKVIEMRVPENGKIQLRDP